MELGAESIGLLKGNGFRVAISLRFIALQQQSLSPFGRLATS